MTARKDGHVINVSSIGVLTNAPRFAAYVSSKAALESFARCAAAEFHDENVHFTIINMPLVRTPMIAPTKLYDEMPTIIDADEAADMIADAIIRKPQRIATQSRRDGADHAPDDAETVRGRNELGVPHVPRLCGGPGQTGGRRPATTDPRSDAVRFLDARHPLVVRGVRII